MLQWCGYDRTPNCGYNDIFTNVLIHHYQSVMVVTMTSTEKLFFALSNYFVYFASSETMSP